MVPRPAQHGSRCRSERSACRGAGDDVRVGASVRRSLGPLERPASRAYRAMFVNTDDLAEAVAALRPGPRILEIGSGDGIVAQKISERCPESTLLGIDVGVPPGAMFSGDPRRVSFRRVPAEALIEEGVEPFDLVLIADVLHHVPLELRAGLVRTAGELLLPGGILVVKETCRVCSPGYPAAVIADRHIGGESNVSFMTEPELERLIIGNVAALTPIARSTLRPWRMNLLAAYRRAA
jgi:2-polyprenyl-3-methyl-5-hydroxy-6-metoxy-1,4-benzoquinol methylase